MLFLNLAAVSQIQRVQHVWCLGALGKAPTMWVVLPRAAVKLQITVLQRRRWFMRARMFLAHLAILAFLTQTATAAVWVFGDSNVDTGWFKIAPFSGDTDFDALLADPTLNVGKPTNNPGPMAVEVLATLLQTTAIPANQGGTNFATSGAKNFNKNDDGFTKAVPTSTQLQNYRHPPGLGSNRAACRPGGVIFCGRPRPGANDIFLINSGGNDVGFAVKNLSEPDRTNYLELQARLLAQAASFLPPFGARQIIVANQQEGSGPNQDVKTARHNYNVALRSALDHYMKGAVYAWADINSVREDIKADQMAGGTKFNILHIDNMQNTACLKPDINTHPNLQTAWALICSANSTVSPLNPNVNVQQTLFADDQHWATGAQKVLASYYYCLIKTTWPQLVPQTIPLPHEPKVTIPCDAFSAIPQPRPSPLR
jgi:phospholipase/lecithinase/hemolysin